MKKIFFAGMAIVTVIVLAGVQSCKSSGSATGTRLMKFNLEKGRGYQYEIVWDMDQSVMGHGSKISIGVVYDVRVEDDKDQVKTMTGTYRSFRMNMDMLGVKIDLDTDHPIGDDSTGEEGPVPVRMMSKVFSAIVGKSFIMKVDEEGKILEVSGFREMMESMADSLRMDAEHKEKMVASLKDEFNDQNVRDQFGQVFTIFPNKEIKVGDSWDKTYTTGGKIPARFTTTYTVKSIEGDHVALDTKCRIESTGQMDLNGEQTGQVLVDSKTGLMINGEFSQEIKANAQEVAIEIKGKGKIKGKVI